MLTVTIYHNTGARFTHYRDGHRLVAVTSHRLPTGAEWDPHAVADWAFHACNADLDQLETGRGTAHGEITFLAACVYRLLGHRALSVGDVIEISTGQQTWWLACDSFGWQHINQPSNLRGQPLTAAKVYQHIRDHGHNR
ncbi:hypothetical protein [Dactylosporangium darangshiense]|uniref:Uncharacterized protein n=1 Tax=Dactylosporangium darangshiense TaxID=579108 RepID=A0ABP8DN71_9ACTN